MKFSALSNCARNPRVAKPNARAPSSLRNALRWSPMTLRIVVQSRAAGGASAQSYPVGYPNGMSVDGNIWWGSGANTSLANQANGAPSALPPGCPAGYNASYLITTEYTHNLWVDPQLSVGMSSCSRVRYALACRCR